MFHLIVGTHVDGKCTSTIRQLLKHICKPYDTAIGYIDERLDILHGIIPDEFVYHDNLKTIVDNVSVRQLEIRKRFKTPTANLCFVVCPRNQQKIDECETMVHNARHLHIMFVMVLLTNVGVNTAIPSSPPPSPTLRVNVDVAYIVVSSATTAIAKRFDGVVLGQWNAGQVIKWEAGTSTTECNVTEFDMAVISNLPPSFPVLAKFAHMVSKKKKK
jgi:hypothetical protein